MHLPVINNPMTGPNAITSLPCRNQRQNLEDGFQLYGLEFRWVESSRNIADSAVVYLVRERESFPANSVTWLRHGDTDSPSFGRIDNSYAYHFEGVADFILPSDGSMLSAYILPEADPGLLSFVLFRGVIPRLLHLRGIPCLHASAVCLGQTLVGFLGDSGCGKSTLAAGLVARGFLFVSDDVLPLRHSPASEIVYAGPGLAEIRLYKRPAELAGVTEHLIAPGRGQTKWQWKPDASVCKETSAPLGQLYLLQPYEPSAHDKSGAHLGPPLTPMQAFMSLTANSFWLHPSETKALASDMASFAKISRSLPIYPLSYALGPKGFGAVEQIIRDSCAALTVGD